MWSKRSIVEWMNDNYSWPWSVNKFESDESFESLWTNLNRLWSRRQASWPYWWYRYCDLNHRYMSKRFVCLSISLVDFFCQWRYDCYQMDRRSLLFFFFFLFFSLGLSHTNESSSTRDLWCIDIRRQANRRWRRKWMCEMRWIDLLLITWRKPVWQG